MVLLILKHQQSLLSNFVKNGNRIEEQWMFGKETGHTLSNYSTMAVQSEKSLYNKCDKEAINSSFRKVTKGAFQK